GDVDGDGTPDVLAGAPGVDVSGPGGSADKGRVMLYSGATGVQLGAKSYGIGPAEFGTAIAVLDDVDGDGRPVIAVGAPGDGKVFVYEVLSVAAPLTADYGGRFGQVVTAVGNIDGLNGRDVIASDPTHDYNYSSSGILYSTPDAGRVYLVSSWNGNLLAAWSPSAHSLEAGWQLLEAGDVTGDGVDDLLVVGRQPNGTPISGHPQRFWSVSGASLPSGSLEVEEVLQTFVANRDVERAGDRNGDGLEDFWFGRPFVDGLGSGAGAVELRSLESQELFVASGGHLGTGIGDALAILDDLDGDGRAEVAVGAPHDGPGDVVSRGTVRVLSGEQVLWSVEGDLADELGAALAVLDDLDGDGVRDLLVGAPFDNVGLSRPGRASVLSGATGVQIRSHGGPLQGDRFGDAVCAVPDVDGDGIGDYAVAAPEASSTFLREGRVELFSGATGATLWSVDGFGGRFGSAIAGSEDFDGDGAGDLLVGAPFELVSLEAFGAGRVYRVSGTSGNVIGSQAGTQPLMRLGSAVASVGDVSGDGLADYL
ncbi:MAG: integrin alpha, partial [Planctomycetota bacterium]